MTQKTPRRVRRRRQAMRASGAEWKRLRIARANWRAFSGSWPKKWGNPVSIYVSTDDGSGVKSFEDVARAVLTPIPSISPEVQTHREFVMRDIAKAFGVPRHIIHDQKETNSAVGHAVANAMEPRGLCPNCGDGSVRNVWGVTNDDAQCINCGHRFNAIERMREMDRQ
jgi:hypothetical protein